MLIQVLILAVFSSNSLFLVINFEFRCFILHWIKLNKAISQAENLDGCGQRPLKTLFNNKIVNGFQAVPGDWYLF